MKPTKQRERQSKALGGKQFPDVFRMPGIPYALCLQQQARHWFNQGRNKDKIETPGGKVPRSPRGHSERYRVDPEYAELCRQHGFPRFIRSRATNKEAGIPVEDKNQESALCNQWKFVNDETSAKHAAFVASGGEETPPRSPRFYCVEGSHETQPTGDSGSDEVPVIKKPEPPEKERDDGTVARWWCSLGNCSNAPTQDASGNIDRCPKHHRVPWPSTEPDVVMAEPNDERKKSEEAGSAGITEGEPAVAGPPTVPGPAQKAPQSSRACPYGDVRLRTGAAVMLTPAISARQLAAQVMEARGEDPRRVHLSGDEDDEWNSGRKATSRANRKRDCL